MRMTSSRALTSASLILAITLSAPLAFGDQKDDTYNKGMAAVNNGDTITARDAFCSLPADFKDAGSQCTTYKGLADKTLFRYKTNYADGLTLMGDGKLDEAAAKFRTVKAGEYADKAKAQLDQIAKLKQQQADSASSAAAAEQNARKNLDAGTAAFNSGNMDAAESALKSVTGSHQGEAQALLQKVSAYKAAVAKGQIFENAKDYQAAKNAYAEAVNINPAGPAAGMLSRVSAAASSASSSNPAPNTTTTTATVKPPAPKQIDVAAYLRDGQKALAKKNYKAAKRYFQEVLGQDPKNQEATDGLAQLNTQDTSTVQASDDDPQLSRYIGAFYSGQYATAEQLLNTYIFNSPKGKGKLGLANFYLGASMLTRYYLTGASDTSLRNEALSKFKAAKDVQGFAPPDKFVSPKIMKAFQEAS